MKIWSSVQLRPHDCFNWSEYNQCYCECEGLPLHGDNTDGCDVGLSEPADTSGYTNTWTSHPQVRVAGNKWLAKCRW